MYEYKIISTKAIVPSPEEQILEITKKEDLEGWVLISVVRTYSINYELTAFFRREK